MSNTVRVRQSHVKSRTGCRECKKRHVKCDEKRPSCGGCLAANRRCPFLDLHHARLPPSRAAVSPAETPPESYSSASPVNSSLGERASVIEPAADIVADTAIDSSASLQSEHHPSPCFDMRHLVLLHHLESLYMTASISMQSISTDEFKLCYEAIFKSAVSASYLMHELLAFSALHLSTLQSNATDKAEYLQQAAELQTRALALFNAVKPSVRNENCLALFIFTSAIGMHTLFDAVASHADSIGFLDKITRYLKLHRGVGAITYQSWHTLRYSEIRYIIDAIEAGDELYRQNLGNAENECDRLMSLVRTSTDKLSSGPLETCQEATQALHWVFGVRRNISEPYLTHITLSWPIRISSEFVELVEQRQPIALIILAHWAVLLHIDRDFWVFGDAGRRIIESLLTHLGSYWDEWLDLPRSILSKK
ncbi:hypothetical protein F5Y02DRAFT_405810 [Annulohypoxylon stygium]|nr:hypothetical protein F5Y02DRAFT_405810 [Annulohypoxylon stygium]